MIQTQKRKIFLEMNVYRKTHYELRKFFAFTTLVVCLATERGKTASETAFLWHNVQFIFLFLPTIVDEADRQTQVTFNPEYSTPFVASYLSTPTISLLPKSETKKVKKAFSTLLIFHYKHTLKFLVHKRRK